MPARTRIVLAVATAAMATLAACTGRPVPTAATGATPAATPSAPTGTPVAPLPLTPPPTPVLTGAPTLTPTPRPTITGEMAFPRTSLPPDWADLGNATLDLPAWGSAGFCPHGPVTLVNGWFPATAGTEWHDGIGSAIALDLDGGGTTEIAVRFDCERSDPGLAQVVGFAHTASGGIRTLGVVVGPGNGGPSDISDLFAAGDRISVGVDNASGSSGAGVEAVLHQARTYGWDGKAFHQTSGSTSFITTAKVSGRGGDMTFAPPAAGSLLGTMTVTLHNDGTTPVG